MRDPKQIGPQNLDKSAKLRKDFELTKLNESLLSHKNVFSFIDKPYVFN